MRPALLALWPLLAGAVPPKVPEAGSLQPKTTAAALLAAWGVAEPAAHSTPPGTALLTKAASPEGTVLHMAGGAPSVAGEW